MQEKQRGMILLFFFFFFSIFESFPLPVRFLLLKYLLWEKYCNYPLTTTQGDLFASCGQNIVPWVPFLVSSPVGKITGPFQIEIGVPN